jgi:large subunit ribosomal protein L23
MKGWLFYQKESPEWRIMSRIEAREVAAGMTADYLGKIAPKSQSLSIAEVAKNEVVAMLTDKFKQEQARFSEENSRESKLYLDGLQKQDNDGKVKSVNTLNTKAKDKRVGRYTGKTKTYKKAIVTLVDGQTIEM